METVVADDICRANGSQEAFELTHPESVPVTSYLPWFDLAERNDTISLATRQVLLNIDLLARHCLKRHKNRKDPQHKKRLARNDGGHVRERWASSHMANVGASRVYNSFKHCILENVWSSGTCVAGPP